MAGVKIDSMFGFDIRRRRFFFVLAVAVFILVLVNFSFLTGQDLKGAVHKFNPLPYFTGGSKEDDRWSDKEPQIDMYSNRLNDGHPIGVMMQQADDEFGAWDEARSRNFKDLVSSYRKTYGRHPPPGFLDWYKFAKTKRVYNFDNFEQIYDDLRPFWSITPARLRHMASNMIYEPQSGIDMIRIRKRKSIVEYEGGKKSVTSWRIDTLKTMIEPFIKHLPDMDISINRLDQPRTVVPWEDLQEALLAEETSRVLPKDAKDGFTKIELDEKSAGANTTDSTAESAQWFNHHGKQYMELASLACPPGSPARPLDPAKPQSPDSIRALFSTSSSTGSFVKSFNMSADLCTVGPLLAEKHGFLFSSATTRATKKLVPIFGECKVSVNNDILFPANMYYLHDKRYDYDPSGDNAPWEDKKPVAVWRGITSGGVQTESNWEEMHRHRFVRLVNSTQILSTPALSATTRQIFSLDRNSDGSIPDQKAYSLHAIPLAELSAFAASHTDIAFSELAWCMPNEVEHAKEDAKDPTTDVCSYLRPYFSEAGTGALKDQFAYKYIVDIDGHSFSGRWSAVLQSRSLGFKSTIFREWWWGRIKEWRHFVPLSGEYNEFWETMGYFVGMGREESSEQRVEGEGSLEHELDGEKQERRRRRRRDEDKKEEDVFVPKHDWEARKIATQGREWSTQVLRREDIEVYMFRLLLEYARLLDDNRDSIGYAGDGSEGDD